MCVIVVKPKGVKMPSNDIIQACAQANRDGFGFCTPNKFFKSVNYDEFRQELKKVDVDEPCIIHFRLATHGNICDANCHPFEKNGVYFAHNGVLDIHPYKGKTDSETAFLKHLSPVIRRYGLLSKELTKKVSEIIGSSKFALMQGDNTVLFGDYLTYSGCHFSNFRFVRYLHNQPNEI